jgi:hypothetical protein
MSQTQTHQGQQRLDDGAGVRQRLGAPDRGAADWALVDGVLASDERMFTALLEAQIPGKRLVTLVFGTRRRRPSSGVDTSSAAEGAAGDPRGHDEGGEGEAVPVVDARYAADDGSSEAHVKAPCTGGHRPGYGRLGAEA